MTPSPTSSFRFFHPLAVALLSILVGVAFISRQSFWMDEAGPAFKALMPTMKDWWFMTLRIGGSDTQMPFYMFILWVWEKIAPPGEFAMRAINLPWLVLAAISLRRFRWWPLVCLTSPFVLYYVGELRPYMMQIAGGSLAAAGLVKIATSDDGKKLTGLHTVASASLILSVSSLTAAIWAAGLWIGVFIMKPEWLRRGLFWKHISPWALAALITFGYYVFTLLRGYQAAGVESGSILSVFFGFYEMIGLLGLGPSKEALRESIKSLNPYLPILFPAFLVILIAWLCGLKTWLANTPRRTVIAVACMVVLPIIFLTTIGMIKDFRVLGRHFSPLIPAVLLPVALAMEGRSRGNIRCILAVTAIGFGFSSALLLRLAERHSRDDFRQASSVALDALGKGQHVSWRSDMNAMRYYAYLKGGMRLVNAVQVLEASPPTLLTSDLVILNRPDLKFRDYDYKAEFRRNDLEIDPTKIHGFEIWRSRYR